MATASGEEPAHRSEEENDGDQDREHIGLPLSADAELEALGALQRQPRHAMEHAVNHRAVKPGTKREMPATTLTIVSR